MTAMAISPDLRPRHIAIVMDGNGRWAKRRMLPRALGHRAGAEAVRKVVRLCGELGIQALTLFAFSTENWQRPEDEVNKLMSLFLNALEKEVPKLHKNQVQLKVIGDIGRFSQVIQQRVQEAEALTANNTGLKLRIAANYGGRWDMLQAMQRFAADNPQDVSQVDEQQLAPYLSTADLPELDLFIRTGGEQRVSNFLLWQLAYAELFFTDTLWPDFDRQALETAIQTFAQRERRFGMTSAQVTHGV